jgi:subtilisin family serine protease
MHIFMAFLVFAVALVNPNGGGTGTAAAVQARAGAKRSVIVVMNPQRSETAAAVAASVNVRPSHTYSAVFKGFAAELPEPAIRALERNPNVAFIGDDGIAAVSDQEPPTGLTRIGGTSNPAAAIDGFDKNIDVDIAILDTGVDPGHPDLNVAGGKACVTGNSSWADDHGHGTKVAGVAAARDNGMGVVGVAPGARIWSVKVADANGSARWSDMICGLDWVAANAGTIDVANMSIAGPGSDGGCNSSGLQKSVCAVVAAGVPLVVAAGNSGQNASAYVPAAFDQVITVGAIVDTDGLPGGKGSGTGSGPDDSVASFSNFGADVDISAPGYNVLTTTRGGGTGGGSGTSFASPYVAGAAALYRVTHPGASPDQVRQGLIAAAAAQRGPLGFSGDRDGMAEPLLWLGGDQTAGTATPTPTATRTPTPTRTPTSIPSATPTMTPTSTATPVVTASPTESIPPIDMQSPTPPAGEDIIEPTDTPQPTATVAPTEIPVPGVTLSKQKSKYNGRVMITVTGFAPMNWVTVRWQDGSVVASVATDATGAGSAWFRTPLVPYGTYRVSASDAAGASANTRLSVISRVKNTAPVATTTGSTLRVYLYGYRPGERVELRWSGESGTTYIVLRTVTIASNGRASTLVTLPAGVSSGTFRIVGKVIGVHRSASVAFTFTIAAAQALASPTPTATATATPIATVSPTVEPTPSPEATMTAVPPATPTVIPMDTPEPTETPTPAIDATATAPPGTPEISGEGAETLPSPTP